MVQKDAFTDNDFLYMARAITIAKKGRYTTSPNPNVGCVIVKDGEIVGEGFHQRAGEGHAEVNALVKAGDKAKDATVYVTLEPCSHYGRTPPCSKRLIEAGVKKVIAAMQDPNPKVSGRGFAMLEQAGIATASGLMREQALALNPGFLKAITENMPYVRCKLAASLDGKTALNNGKSQWITATQARRDVQQFRAEHCAILTGADTVIHDQARLNVRYEELNDYPFSKDSLRQPIRVVVDSQNRLTPDLALFSIESPVILLRSVIENQQQWPHFVTQLKVPLAANSQKLDLTAALKLLAKHDINSVWLEAGHTLAGQFIQQRLVDELVLYQAPKLLGDTSKSLIKIDELTALEQAIELDIQDIRTVGKDIRIIAKLLAEKISSVV